MTDDLRDLLARRADRAHTPTHPDRLVDTFAELVETRTRHRRNRLAVASGAVVLVAAATVGVAVVDPGHGPGSGAGTRSGSHPAAPGQAGGPKPVVVESGNLASLLPHYRALHGNGAGHGTRAPKPGGLTQALRRAAEEQAAARRAAARQARQARQARRRAADTAAHLVPVDPAPAGAEISLGLAPSGFDYLSHGDAETYYGPSGLAPDRYFSDGIVVDVQLFAGDTSDYTLTVDGRPAAFYSSADGVMVRVRYSDTIDVGFQAPAAAGLTEQEALRMAASLEVRSTANTTKG